jgi:hypothetical protein
LLRDRLVFLKPEAQLYTLRPPAQYLVRSSAIQRGVDSEPLAVKRAERGERIDRVLRKRLLVAVLVHDAEEFGGGS